MAPTPRRNSRMAPYFVQIREYERRLLRDAILTVGGDVNHAARVLGVTRHYLWARARLLGGVLDGDPKHEPPGEAADAWARTNTRSRRPSLDDAPDPESAAEDLIDGQDDEPHA